LRQNRLRITFLGDFLGHRRGKVAVGTFGEAIGKVDVEAQARRAQACQWIGGSCGNHDRYFFFSCASRRANFAFSEAAISIALSATTSFFLIATRSAFNRSRSSTTSERAELSA